MTLKYNYHMISEVVIKIKEYNHEIQSLTRTERKILYGRKLKGSRYFDLATQVEKIMVKINKLRVHLDDLSSKGDVNAHKLQVQIQEYLYWIKTRVIESNRDLMYDQLSDSDKLRMKLMDGFMSIIGKDNQMTNTLFKQSIITLHSNDFGPDFLEKGFRFYIQHLDPLGYWFTPCQLYEIFKDGKQHTLLVSIILYILRFSRIKDISILNKMLQSYYSYIKLALPNIYINPSHHNLLTIIMLANYEASCLRLNAHKNLMTSAIKMAQMLKYHEITPKKLSLMKSGLHNNNFFNMERNMQLWYKIVINCVALGSILGEKMLDCLPRDPKFTDIMEKYQHSKFLIKFTKPMNISKIFIIDEALNYIKKLISIFNRLNYYHAEWRILFTNITMSDLEKLYISLPTEKNEELDKNIHEIRRKFSNNRNLLNILNQCSNLARWLNSHHCYSNWLTFAPVYMVGIYPLIVLFPLSMSIAAPSAIDLIQTSIILDHFFEKYFENWCNYFSQNLN